MAEDIISIGIGLETSQVLTGTKQVDAALKALALATAAMAEGTKKLDQASKGAAQAMTTESTAAKGTTQSLRQMGEAAKGASQNIGGISSAMRSFASQTASFALAQAGVQGMQQALSTAKDALVDLVKTGIQMQNLRTSFAAASGSAKAGADDFRFVTKTANELGLGLQSVAEQYRSLSAATRGTSLQGADTRELFVTLSKAAQAYGLSTEQLGRAMTAFQQIISKGKVSMEELSGQLGEAIPGAMQIAARAYGTNTQALQAMIEKGVAAEEFVRRFMTQLGAEVPQAAERAGKGIAKFANEILLLKDSIGRSGLIGTVDTLIGKLGDLMEKTRKADEALQRTAERRAARGVGAETFEGLAAPAKEQLVAQQRREMEARTAYEARLKVQPEGTNFLGIKTQTQVAKELYEAEQQRTRALEARLVLQDAERKEQAQRQAASKQGFAEQRAQVQALDEADKQLKTTLESTKKAQEDFAKAAALTPELYGKANGTLKEQLTLLEKRNAVTKKGLEDVTEQILARPAGAGAVPADLQAKKTALQEQYRAETAAIESTKKAIEDVADAERKREQDKKDAAAEAKRLAAETERLDKQQAEEVARAHFQSIEQLRRLAAQYSETKTERDADTAATLAQSLATSQYNAEAQKQLEIIQKGTQALEDRRKVEEKLPSLREEAQASKSALEDLNRLEQQLEPRRRTLSRREQMKDTINQMVARARPEDQAEVARRAGEKAQRTLAFESAQEDLGRLEDFATATFDHMGDALTQFAFHGKLTFKDMVNSIIEDFYRMSLQTVAKQLMGEGGWVGLLQKGLSLAAGLFGGGKTSGTLPTTMADYALQAAAGRFSGRQGGGPVSAGTPYWVGERGPELFVPRRSGTVVPAHQVGGQAPVINVYVTGVADAQSFVASQGAVQRAIARTVSSSYRAM